MTTPFHPLVATLAEAIDWQNDTDALSAAVKHAFRAGFAELPRAERPEVLSHLVGLLVVLRQRLPNALHANLRVLDAFAWELLQATQGEADHVEADRERMSALAAFLGQSTSRVDPHAPKPEGSVDLLTLRSQRQR